MRTPHVYLNGAIVPLDDARVSPLDIGLLRGYAVFDLLRTAGGRPFLLAEHLRRLRASADDLGLTVPATDAEIAEVIARLLELNVEPGDEATVRLVLTGGASPDGMTFDPTTPTFLIMTHRFSPPPASVYEEGGKLLTQAHRREVPSAKSTNYLTMLRHKPRLAEEGALDLLYHDDERVYEAASASFYIVRDGVIFAPENDVLWGTVGSLLLGSLDDDVEVRFGDFSLEDALDADEAFLTSTTRGIVPIVSLDERPIGDGTPGPMTRRLMWKFAELVEAASTS